MNFTGVPIIIISCYIIGEFYKVLFKKKKELYRLIPIMWGVIGGILGIIIYLTAPEIIFNVKSIWLSLEIGLISGLSSTGTNQIVKQMISKI